MLRESTLDSNRVEPPVRMVAEARRDQLTELSSRDRKERESEKSFKTTQMHLYLINSEESVQEGISYSFSLAAFAAAARQ